MSVRWPTWPYKSFRDIYPDHASNKGHFRITPGIISELSNPPPIPTFEPSGKELAILKRHYPDADDSEPPWEEIRADLVVGRISPADIKESNASQIMLLLDRVHTPPRRQPDNEASREKLLDLFRRRGIEPLAYICEVAWNLREWLREISRDRTLQPVLDVLLPGLRRRLELSLLDCELSRFAPSLPSGNQLNAANLIAFIEGLKFPGNTALRIPAGEPPEGAKWLSLSRKRAIRIAIQVCDPETSQPMYDSESENDLDTIEALDSDVLTELWKALEAFDPFIETEVSDATGESPKPDAPNNQLLGEWSAPMPKIEMARRITGRRNARAREVEALLEEHGLKHHKGNKWIVRLDKMDANTRRKLEQPE